MPRGYVMLHLHEFKVPRALRDVDLCHTQWLCSLGQVIP